VKREVPVLISLVVGLILLGEFFLKIPAIATASGEIQNWGVIIAAFALALAAINLIRIHATRIARGGREAIHSTILVGGLAVTFISGVFLGTKSVSFDFIFQGIYTPLAAAFYAMTAFHLASASYRAFRAKNAQAAALLVTGMLLMLGRAPIGEVMWNRFPAIADWIMGVINLAGSRGIIISTSVGVTGVGLRVLLGIDRSHLGTGE
jgi:hypothetical protein